MIKIFKCPTAGTSECNHNISKDALARSTQMHISDVKKGLDFFVKKILDAGENHDYTKLQFMDAFYEQFREAGRTGKWPEGNDWWYHKYHLLERHHLEDRVPGDVNLVDILESLVDCCMAGMARTGKYVPESEPSPELLKKAFENTRDLLLKQIQVLEDPTPPETLTENNNDKK